MVVTQRVANGRKPVPFVTFSNNINNKGDSFGFFFFFLIMC